MYVVASLFATSLHAAQISIKTVSVGDEHNSADPLTGYGAVQDPYKIGRTEVTAEQYCAFLNAVATKSDLYKLYNSKMASDSSVASIQQIWDASSKLYQYKTIKGAEHFPIVYVSWLSAARYCNWLQNNQPIGEEGAVTTERGAYHLDGYMGGVVPVEKDATWSLPTEDEWYKAAYYKGGGTNTGYWLYPTQHDTAPDNKMTGASGNSANIFILVQGKSWWGFPTTQETYSCSSAPFLTSVDTFSNAAGYYQTYDMGGNVFEWVDAHREGLDPTIQVVRGGAWSKEFGAESLKSSYRNMTNHASLETNAIGFRVVNRKKKLMVSFVTVGDPGNPPDMSTGHGAVSDVFRIGKYPITVEQYCLFLNSIASISDPYYLYKKPWVDDEKMNGPIDRTSYNGHFFYSVKPSRVNTPMNYLDFFSAARFCNWLHNGCPEGEADDSTTEKGAYSMNGLYHDPNDPSIDGTLAPASKDARYYIPSEDEWYKAAYYNGHGGYFRYPTKSDTPPSNILSDGENQANYHRSNTTNAVSLLTPVDFFSGTASYYGVCDMAGNVYEWNTTEGFCDNIMARQARGGCFKMPSSAFTKEESAWITVGNEYVGFRIAAPVNNDDQ